MKFSAANAGKGAPGTQGLAINFSARTAACTPFCKPAVLFVSRMARWMSPLRSRLRALLVERWLLPVAMLLLLGLLRDSFASGKILLLLMTCLSAANCCKDGNNVTECLFSG